MKTHAIPPGGGLLSDVPVAGKVRIAAVEVVESEKMRLISMGLRKGTELEVKSNSGKGPLVVALGNSRLALGRVLARKIRVV